MADGASYSDPRGGNSVDRRSLGPTLPNPYQAQFSSPLALLLRALAPPTIAQMQEMQRQQQQAVDGQRAEYIAHNAIQNAIPFMPVAEQAVDYAGNVIGDVTGQRHPENGYSGVQQFASDVLDPTGIPSLARGIGHTANSIAYRGDPQRSADEAGAAIPDVAMGGLGILGMLGGGGEGAVPREAPVNPLDRTNLRNMGFDEATANDLARLSGPDIPTPEEFLGRPLTPDHIWNDPRFQHRLAMTSDLEGVRTPEERFNIAGERVSGQPHPSAPTARIVRVPGSNGARTYYELHHPSGGGEFHGSIRSAQESAQRQGWNVERPEMPEMPEALAGSTDQRIARQRQITASNEASAEQMMREQGLDAPPKMAGIPDYLAGWPGRGFEPGATAIDNAGRESQGQFTQELLEGELGPYRVGGPYQDVPLLGTPEVGADPLSNPSRPGFTPRPDMSQRLSAPNEDRRWPMFGTLSPPFPESFLPIDQPQAFTNSFRGGAQDLRGAAQHDPMFANSDIDADPLANPTRPGVAPTRTPGPPEIPNEDRRYLGFGNPESPTASAPDAGGAGVGRVRAYRGSHEPELTPDSQGVFWFHHSPDAASGYAGVGEGGNVSMSDLHLGRTLEIDAGGARYDEIPLGAVPSDVRSGLPTARKISRLSVDYRPGGPTSRPVTDTNTDVLAAEARRLGYDSITVRNVQDDGWKTTGPGTVTAVFSRDNVHPPGTPPATPDGGAAGLQQYSFDGPRNQRVEVGVLDNGSVHFSVKPRRYASGVAGPDTRGTFTGPEARQILRGVNDAVAQDAARFGRSEYHLTPQDPRMQDLARHVAVPEGYTAEPTQYGVTLRRSDGGASAGERWDTETFYTGTASDAEHVAGDGIFGRGTYITRDPEWSDFFANRAAERTGGAANVRPVHRMAGRYASASEYRSALFKAYDKLEAEGATGSLSERAHAEAQRALRARGVLGVEGNNSTQGILVFDQAHTRSTLQPPTQGAVDVSSPEATPLRRELQDHGFDVPQGQVQLPNQRIDLASIRTMAPQGRGVDSATVRDYASRTTQAPPILVRRDRNGWHLIDGNHRLEAARSRGDTQIDALDASSLFQEGRTPQAPNGGAGEGGPVETPPSWRDPRAQ